MGILAFAAIARTLGLHRRAAISPFPPYGQARLGAAASSRATLFEFPPELKALATVAR